MEIQVFFAFFRQCCNMRFLFIPLFVINFLFPVFVSAATTDHFVIKVQTFSTGASADNEFEIPTYPGETYNYDVDIDNNGSWDYVGITGNTTCVYSTSNTYTIRIRGTFPMIYFFASNDKDKIVDIVQWGTGAWSCMERAFWGCTSLMSTATDAPDLSGVTTTAYMFSNASIFNADFSGWDTSTIVDMRNMFTNCTALSGNFSNWNTTNVKNMSYMFAGTQNMFVNLNNWDVSNVTDMTAMFHSSSYNQGISNWDTSSVQNMSYMFYDASMFNDDIGNWNTGNVTTMVAMFFNAIQFNQDLSSWNTGNVTTMSGMFRMASSFNQDLGSWNVASLTNASNMLDNVSLSINNYDSLLTGWNAQSLQSGLTLSAGSCYYYSEAAQTARANMISSDGWTIIDRGMLVLPTTTPTPGGTATVTPTITPTVTTTPTLLTSLNPDGQDVVAFPNPATTYVNFSLKEIYADAVAIHVYNLKGDPVALVEASQPGQLIRWQLDNIASGVYLYQVKLTKDEKTTRLKMRKIVITK